MNGATGRRRRTCPLFQPANVMAALLFAGLILNAARSMRAESSPPNPALNPLNVNLETTASFALATTKSMWPDGKTIRRVVFLQDYNTRVVVLGTLLLGICGGTVGTFVLLRKRSLIGDVVSHASLPGIAIAFLVMESIEAGSGRSLPGLLIGAVLAGLAGVVCTIAIRRWSRIKDDAALAIVLSIFFGLGIALFTVVQNIPAGNTAGLHHFIYGKAASMSRADVELIAGSSLVVLVVCGLLLKEFSLLCFDEEFAAVQGWPVVWLDLALMGLVVGVTVIGLQSVGLLLVVALMIVPAAAARFWTDHLARMTLISAGLGGAGAFAGTMTSALFPRLPTGAVIVLAATALFVLSLFLGTRRGVVWRVLIHSRLKRRVGRHDLLRAIYELLEPSIAASEPIDFAGMRGRRFDAERLSAQREWTERRLQRLLSAAVKDNLIHGDSSGRFQLTERGAVEARRVVRNHRLWEIYLITYADIAPSHVDRDADLIEHVLDPELIEELDSLLSERFPQMAVPPSPHVIRDATPNLR